MPKRTARIPCIRLSAHVTNRREMALRKMACSFIASLLASHRLAARGDRAWVRFPWVADGIASQALPYLLSAYGVFARDLREVFADRAGVPRIAVEEAAAPVAD